MIKGRDDGILIGEIIRFKETAQTVQAEEKRQPVRGKAGRMGTEEGKRGMQEEGEEEEKRGVEWRKKSERRKKGRGKHEWMKCLQ